MSIIANALQKQSENRVFSMPSAQTESAWRAALIASLLCIILLLVALVFILFKQPAVNPLSYTPLEAASSSPLGGATAVEKKKPIEKSISRVSFVTQKMPKAINKISHKPAKALALDTVRSQPHEIPKTRLSKSGEKQPDIDLSAENKLQDLQNIDYSHVSSELKQRFVEALSVSEEQVKEVRKDSQDDSSDIFQMESNIQRQIPAISYEFHVYSSIADERWVRINGEDLEEGEFDSSGKIQVVEVLLNKTIFHSAGHRFSLKSLVDWQGL